MLRDLRKSGDRRARHTEELATHGYGRKREGRCDGRDSTHVWHRTVLVHVERGQGRPECLEKVAEPQKLPCKLLERRYCAARRGGQQAEQFQQTAQLSGVQLHSIVLKVKGPPNPRHTGGQGGLAPTHGHPERAEHDYEQGG